MSEAQKPYTVLEMTPENMHIYFGKYAMKIQNACFHVLGQICEDYHGGAWQLRRYLNGAIAFVLDDTEGDHEVTPFNGNNVSCTLEAASLSAYLISVSHFCMETFELNDHALNSRFHDFFHGVRDMLCGEMGFVIENGEAREPTEAEMAAYEALGATYKERQHPQISQILSIID